jgi:NAD dependent epimerase/dehydratase family enzyme
VPKWALEVVLGGEMADELILTSQRVTPGILRSSSFKFEHDDADAALKWALNNRG